MIIIRIIMTKSDDGERERDGGEGRKREILFKNENRRGSIAE